MQKTRLMLLGALLCAAAAAHAFTSPMQTGDGAAKPPPAQRTARPAPPRAPQAPKPPPEASKRDAGRPVQAGAGGHAR